jgi:cephalosporin hydroxylase
MTNDFMREVAARIAANGNDRALLEGAHAFLLASLRAQYSYNFSWLGRPIIQYPQDMVAMQEIIWRARPDLIVETGIAHGGSLILSASMLALLDYCDAVEAGRTLDPRASGRRVLGIDIDIRAHNRAAIEAHPMSHRVELLQGSSIDPQLVAQVQARAKGYQRVLVCLDSNHTHEHVLAELEAYAQLASLDSYCVVFDTVIEEMPADSVGNRPWSRGNSPASAVGEYLKAHPEFEIDRSLDRQLLVSVAPGGYLKRVR